MALWDGCGGGSRTEGTARYASVQIESDGDGVDAGLGTNDGERKKIPALVRLLAGDARFAAENGGHCREPDARVHSASSAPTTPPPPRSAFLPSSSPRHVMPSA